MEIHPIFSGHRKDFSWVGFGSGSGTSVERCIETIPPVGIVCDKPSAAMLKKPIIQEFNPIVADGYAMCGKSKIGSECPEAEIVYLENCRRMNELISYRL